MVGTFERCAPPVLHAPNSLAGPTRAQPPFNDKDLEKIIRRLLSRTGAVSDEPPFNQAIAASVPAAHGTARQPARLSSAGVASERPLNASGERRTDGRRRRPSGGTHSSERCRVLTTARSRADHRATACWPPRDCTQALRPRAPGATRFVRVRRLRSRQEMHCLSIKARVRIIAMWCKSPTRERQSWIASRAPPRVFLPKLASAALRSTGASIGPWG